MDFLYRQARRCNINLYIVSMIIIIVGGIIAFLPIRDFYLSTQPYKELNVAKLKSENPGLGFLSDFYYIDATEYIDTGTEPFIASVKVGKTREISLDEDYILAKSGEYWMPIRLQDKLRENKNRYTGKISGIKDEVFEEIKVRAKKEYGKDFDEDKLINVTLDTVIKDSLLTKIAIIISSILLLVFIVNVCKLISRIANPYRSPVFKDLSLYGEIQEVEEEINKEMEVEEFSIFQKVVITRSWFLSKRFFTVDIIPLTYIVRAYTKTEWKKWNGIIPIYKRTILNIITKDNIHYRAAFKLKTGAEDILEKFRADLPWVTVGASTEIKKN